MEAIILSAQQYKELVNRLDILNKKLEEKQKSPNDTFLDNQEFLQLMNISKRTAQSWRDEGKVSFSQIGSKIYYRMSDVQKLLDKIGKFPSIVLTFIFVMIGWVIFKIEDFALLKVYLLKLFQPVESFEFNTIPEFSLIVCFAVLFAFITSLKFGQKIGEFMFERDSYKVKSHVALSVMSIVLFILSLKYNN